MSEEMAIYYDASKCTACRGCQAACKVWNELPSPIDFNSGICTGSYQNPADLDPNTRLIITFNERERENGYGVDWAFGRRSCMHCTNAGCVNVCPSGALYHDPDGTGLVIYDKDKCIGCQYCRSGCPYDVPRHTGVGIQGAGIKINKCTGCIDRVRNGRKPACVSTCQPNALDFGPRSEMLERAHARVDALKKKGFADASVYGETECGGCHTIMVLKYDRSMYTHVPENAEPSGLTEALGFMKPLAAVGAAGIVAGLGLSFLTGVGYKRDRLYYDENAHDEIDVDTGEVIKHIDKEKGER